MEDDKRFVIGLDFGGTFLKYALGSSTGKFLYKSKIPSKADKPTLEIFDVIFNAIDDLLDKAKERGGKVVAGGMGSPGAIDFNKGRLIGKTPNIPDWNDTDFRGKIEGRYNIPFWFDNDANVMALAETRQGAGKEFNNVIALTLGTGIGGGILINNQLYRGSYYAAAELGHMSICYDGPQCNCGNLGCIEEYAAAPGMVRNYLNKLEQVDIKPKHKVTTIDIFDHAKQGEKEAIDTIDETCLYLGVALANFAHIFNPDAFIIGGGVSDAGPEFLQKIENHMRQRAMPPCAKDVQVLRAELGNDAGMIGAFWLALDNYSFD